MSTYWFWLDLEMTGLDPQADRILEAAAIVTRVLPVGVQAGEAGAVLRAAALVASGGAAKSYDTATVLLSPAAPLANAATASRFEAVAEFETAVFQPQDVLDNMNEWSRKTHGESGLTAHVPHGIAESALDAVLCELADRYWGAPVVHSGVSSAASDAPATDLAISTGVSAPSTKASGVILCGNSIGQDRKFVDRYLPNFASRLHYRMLDVSSFKIVYQELYGKTFKKQGTHRALDDIRESIAELESYLPSGS